MKELLQQYAAYNIWATGLLIETINKLPADATSKEIISSFPSVYKTVQHLWMAEEVWWKRLQLTENIVLESLAFTGSFTDMTEALQKQSRQLKAWVDNATEKQIDHVFAFVRNKEYIKMPAYQMLHHVFNHASYHRGQLVTMLNQLGAGKIPSTDFSTFSLKK